MRKMSVRPCYLFAGGCQAPLSLFAGRFAPDNLSTTPFHTSWLTGSIPFIHSSGGLTKVMPLTNSFPLTPSWPWHVIGSAAALLLEKEFPAVTLSVGCPDKIGTLSIPALRARGLLVGSRLQLSQCVIKMCSFCQGCPSAPFARP
jgi:hypothetical protein